MSFTDCNNSSVVDAALFYFSNGLQPVLIRAKEKRPFEDGWQNKKFNDEKEVRAAFENHKGNIGLRGNDDGLIGIDCDDDRFKTALFRVLPMLANTLQSRGKKETGHCWVRLTKPLKNQSIRLHFENQTKQTFADLRGIGGQIVVAPSIHPDGPKYQWLNNNPILPLDTDVFLDALDIACAAVGAKNPYRKEEAYQKPKQNAQTSGLFESVKECVKLSDVLHNHTDRMDCIFHKEQTPTQAMRLYPKSNSVYCFSCGKAGDVISIHAQQHHIGQYEAAIELAKIYCPKVLEKLAKTNTDYNVAKNESTWPIIGQMAVSDGHRTRSDTSNVSDSSEVETTIGHHRTTSDTGHHTIGVCPVASEQRKKVVEFVKMKDYVPVQVGRVYIPPFLAAGTINAVAAPRSSFKSTLTCFMASRLGAGMDFLDFKIVAPLKVVVWDCENGEYHAHALLNGCIASLPSEKAQIDAKENISLTVSQYPMELVPVLQAWTPDTAPNILILDGLRRFLGGDENDSMEVSKFFMEIKPEVERLGIALIFIHHARKSQQGATPSDFEDKMDSIRGSGDIAAMCSSIILLKRVGESEEAHLTFAKCRWAKEPKPRSISVTYEEEKVMVTTASFGSREDFENRQRANAILAHLQKTGETEAKIGDLATTTGIQYKSLQRTLGWMIEQKWAEKKAKGRYAFLLYENQTGALFGSEEAK